MARTLKNLSVDAIEVLGLLPKEPIACPIPDIAQDIFGKTDSISISKIKKALNELSSVLYHEFCNTRSYSHKHRFGIRANKWIEVQEVMRGEK